MGLHGGPPEPLIHALRDAFSVDRFLETGTHRGTTAAWAAEHFAQVVTIEASEALHREAIAAHGRLENIRFVLGDTRLVLRREVERIGGPAIVWLDSHWCGGETYGESDECPLLFEIQTVRASPHEHYIFIDDARCFLAPPPRPHSMEAWPALADVTAALTTGPGPLDLIVLEDVIIAVPPRAKALVWRYAQDVTTKAWDLLNAPVAEERLAVLAARRLGARARSVARHLGKRT